MATLLGYSEQNSAARSGQHRLRGRRGRRGRDGPLEGGSGEQEAQEERAGPVRGLTTHCLQQTDVLSKGSDTAAEGEEEHEDAHHDQQDSRVHRQAGQGCFWEKGCPSAGARCPLRGLPGMGEGCTKCVLPVLGGPPCLVKITGKTSSQRRTEVCWRSLACNLRN